MSNHFDRPTSVSGRIALLSLVWLCLTPIAAWSQPANDYLLEQRPGEQRPGLEMIVHIFGEVQRPGEYRVGDGTDVLELISKAGGPTEFARLEDVVVRRFSSGTPPIPDQQPSVSSTSPQVSILIVNVRKAWQRKDAVQPPPLQPGDMIYVPRNSWHTYKRLSTVVKDAAIVVSTYLLYLRIIKD